MGSDQRNMNEDAAHLEALKKAAETGWRDFKEGLYMDVTEDELDEFIGKLGSYAVNHARAGR